MTTLQAASSASANLTLAAVDKSNPSNASTAMVGGRVQFDNDSYAISMGDDNSVNIHNKLTGENYQVWGDPHVNIDGQHAFDFWGTTTFALDDGTKVTVQTTPWANSASATLASKVTITNGNYGVQVSGIDSNSVGDLAFEEGKGWGYAADALVDDGNTLYENTSGSGFKAFDADGRLRQVDQQLIDETDLTRGGALQDRFAAAFRAMGGLLSILFVGAFFGGGQSARSADAPVSHPPAHDLGGRLQPLPFEAAGERFALLLAAESRHSGWYRAAA